MERAAVARLAPGRAVKAALLEGTAAKTFAVVFQTGDEVTAGLLDFARTHRVTAARFTAIGAFSDVTLGYFDWQTKQYERIPVNEQVEVVSLLGDFAIGEKNEPKLHAHVVVAKRDGSTMGGHLLEAHVRPTLEVIVDEETVRLQRRYDPESGLALIRLD